MADKIIERIEVVKDNDLRGNLYTVIVDGEILLECVDYKDIGVMLSSYLRNPERFKEMY